MKKIKFMRPSKLAILICLCVLTQLFSPKALALSQIKLIVDGQDITSIAQPIIQNDRTLVPIRFVAEQLGAKVTWNNEDRTVLVEKGKNSVLLRIDSHLVLYQKDEKVYDLCDVPPTIINERTYVPLRLISNALGIGIDWNQESRTVYVDSSKNAEVISFFDVRILSLNPGQAITGKTELQISLPKEGIKNGTEIKYLLLDPANAKGVVVARGNGLTSKYNWLPNLEHKGEKVLVAAIYNDKGEFIAGNATYVQMDVNPKVSLTGLSQGQAINGTVSIGADTNFVPSYVKYEIINQDNNKVVMSSEADPQGLYNWTPMLEDNGNYSFKAIAYDENGKAYESQSISAKVQMSRKLALSGVSSGRTIDKPVTLSTSRNFHVSETEYVLRDPKTGKEETLAKMGYGSYKWFPGPEYSGNKELLVRVKDTRGITHESSKVSVNLSGAPKLFLDGVGPKQVLTTSVKLNTISNVSLDSVNYIIINAKTGARKALASGQSPLVEYTYTPIQGQEGSWKLQAEGIYNSGTKILSEEVPVTVYLGKTYSSSPIIEKDKFLGLASDLAKGSWEKTGMSAALQTAQAILETGWGQSVPVDKYKGNLSYNLFGIKGKGTVGSVISNTWEEYNGKAFRVDAEFRAYNNIDESWSDHKNLLLKASRYEPFREVMHDSTLGAWALRRAGYATDSQYPIKLMRIIKQYNLQELDKIGI
ncbi:Flagellum-specific peptidoglycan hydrolase FlgJ [Proteiniborus ethanoligenes]|uniref:Flagellum-specific peptidoglycan hydrolase FlgJ n=1 Tax=Proteiniborus ethanoligenes TaxID=415015 RepID=A0A1H3KVZ1_9FIRM|nr:stalk domain-containing protein [Proteiniborus ethanoligenes]SDY55845.1 Flagellum-specific peptidoglycan hydrolase FlgJ [Proteiniborus ethanoligenes]